MGCGYLHAESPKPASPLSAEQESRYHALIHGFRCVVCQNQSIADSDAPIAHDFREKIKHQLGSGWTDGQIRTFWVDRYGDFIVLNPPLKPSTWVLWAAPVLAIGGVGWVIGWRYRSGRLGKRGARHD